MAPIDDREPHDEQPDAAPEADEGDKGPEPAARPRRDVLGIALGGSVAAFAVALGYPVVRFVEPRARPQAGTATVGKVEEFPVGQAKIVLVSERPVLLIRTTDGQFRAFSAVCTHLQCIVNYVPERNQIECPCHQGVYSIDGQNISGPPPRPLEEMLVTVNEGTVIVSMVG